MPYIIKFFDVNRASDRAIHAANTTLTTHIHIHTMMTHVDAMMKKIYVRMNDDDDEPAYMCMYASSIMYSYNDDGDDNIPNIKRIGRMGNRESGMSVSVDDDDDVCMMMNAMCMYAMYCGRNNDDRNIDDDEYSYTAGSCI